MSKDLRGDSSVQQRAEIAMRKLLEDDFGPLVKLPWKIDDEVTIEIDAARADGSVIIEIFARQGPLNDGQKKKIAKDILKLALIGLGEDSIIRRLVIAHANPAITNHIKNDSWLSRAAAKFGIEEHCLSERLDPQLRAEIREAEKIQERRGNAF